MVLSHAVLESGNKPQLQGLQKVQACYRSGHSLATGPAAAQQLLSLCTQLWPSATSHLPLLAAAVTVHLHWGVARRTGPCGGAAEQMHTTALLARLGSDMESRSPLDLIVQLRQHTMYQKQSHLLTRFVEILQLQQSGTTQFVGQKHNF